MKLPCLAILTLLSIGGCTTVDSNPREVGIDPDLAQHAEYFTINKKDTFWPEDQLNVTMGPYQVSQADQGSKRTESSGDGMSISSIFDYDKSQFKSKQRLSFNFNGAQGQTWAGRCEKQFSGASSSVDLAHNSTISNHTIDNVNYRCVFKANELSWVLEIDHSSHFESQAFIVSPNNQKWYIESFRQSVGHQYGRGYSHQPGFYIIDKGLNVAAVSLGKPGQFWLDKEQPSSHKDVLAMSAIGLWYFENGFYDEP